MKYVVTFFVGILLGATGVMLDQFLFQRSGQQVQVAKVESARDTSPAIDSKVITTARSQSSADLPEPVRLLDHLSAEATQLPPELQIISDMPIARTWGWEAAEQSVIQSSGKDSEFTAYLTNSSGGDLDIFEFRIGCGCKVTSPTTPLRLVVGQRVEVKGTIEWHAGGSIGMLALSNTGEKAVAVFICQ